MVPKEKVERKEAAKSFSEMLSEFAGTVGKILDDPDVKAKAKEFAKSVVDSAAKVVESRVEDEELKAKFRSVGKAAQDLGTSLEEKFKPEKKKSAASKA